MLIKNYSYFTGIIFVSPSVTSTTSQSLAISWTIVLAEVVNASYYTIFYLNTDPQCFTVSNVTEVAASETMYTLTGLQEGTEYSITVTAMLSDRSTGEDSLTATTMATG